MGFAVIGALAIGFAIAAIVRHFWPARDPVTRADSPEKIAELNGILKAYEDGRLWPPKDVRNPEAWDQYWRNILQFGAMEVGFGDMMASSPEFVEMLKGRGVRRVLCVGNGMSGEALSLALFGFEVTALDLSSVPASMFHAMFSNPDNPLVRSSAVALRDDGIVEIGNAVIDPDLCPRIHRRDGQQPVAGGTLQFVTGDVLSPSTCPGPFDAVIERRTLQLFAPDDQRNGLEMIEARLAPRGIVVSHQHNGAWRPDQPRKHFAEEWVDARGFGRLRMKTPDGEQAPRLADLWYTSG